jgi:DNA repair protein RecO (recombination protein O)
VVAIPREPLQRCFVLHQRDYGNTSLLLDLFIAEAGRLPVLAKGAKRGRAALGAILQPFHPLWASWTGRGEVRTLTSAEAAGTPPALRGQALFCGLYLNELLTRLLERGDPHPALFAFYHAALQDLAGGAHLETGLRQFELRLLGELGYGPLLDQAAEGPIRAEERYCCVPGQPPRRVQAGEGEAQTLHGATLLALVAGETLGEAWMAREARDLLRRLLAPHLGTRPLKSRELFRQARGKIFDHSAQS